VTASGKQSWGFSLFCDDIRAEVGGKISVMGVYQVDLILPGTITFPTALPKFCILVKYYERLGSFEDDISIKIFNPSDAKDAPSFNLTSKRTTLPPPLYPLEDDQEGIFNLTIPITFAPFPIQQEGFLKVRAHCGSIITNLGSLMIRKARRDENFGPGPAVSATPAV
jgi:hypothetical protein